jgi:hypothetical protein
MVIVNNYKIRSQFYKELCKYDQFLDFNLQSLQLVYIIRNKILKDYIMKKSFQLNIDGKDSARVLDSIKNEIRKYIKREKRKKLPIDADYWLFDCKFGKGDSKPKVVKFIDIMGLIDGAAKDEEVESFYLELIASPAKRKPREKRED